VDKYENLTCAACGQIHLVKSKTGKRRRLIERGIVQLTFSSPLLNG
jgi:hypothetical protein